MNNRVKLYFETYLESVKPFLENWIIVNMTIIMNISVSSLSVIFVVFQIQLFGIWICFRFYEKRGSDSFGPLWTNSRLARWRGLTWVGILPLHTYYIWRRKEILSEKRYVLMMDDIQNNSQVRHHHQKPLDLFDSNYTVGVCTGL
jgi:hypothetical protein